MFGYIVLNLEFFELKANSEYKSLNCLVYFRTAMQSDHNSLTASVSSNVPLSGSSGGQVRVVISHSRRENTDTVLDLTRGSRSSQVCPRLLSSVTGLLIVPVIFRVLVQSPHPR